MTETPRRLRVGERVFVTGHTGFKGGWLSTWLLHRGADVVGYALPPPTTPSFFARCGLARRMRSIAGDVRDGAALRSALAEASPAVVVHMAAQPLVRRSYADPVETFGSNVMGTVNLLEAVRATPSVRAVVVVTTDKCYRNTESGRPYGEEDELGGRDPYSASKACAEIVTGAYRASFFTASGAAGVASARAGNVFGGGDWSEDRLVPDMVRAAMARRPVVVRNPRSTRPWQHVIDVLSGYMMLAERLLEQPDRWSGAWNFGPAGDAHLPVSRVVEAFVRRWQDASWTVVEDAAAPYEAKLLSLDPSKARGELGWETRLDLDAAMALTVDWHRADVGGATEDEMFQLTCEQIAAFEEAAARTEG